MKNLILLTILLSNITFGQDTLPKRTSKNKGTFYVYWGWNRGAYTNSDIHFQGTQYDFTLLDVQAKDRQSNFAWDTYFQSVTIPQYNLRIGYFLTEKYSLSLGVDHMKYVMVDYQTTTIDGKIATGSVYDGSYKNSIFNIEPKFLKFEHTDGLNYINTEIRRHDKLYQYKKVTFNLTEGFGGGILLPRTNTTLLNYPRYDQFHLAGFGLGGILGLNVEFWNRFFIQAEGKAGYINMPDIRTTMHEEDKASQQFGWIQGNVVFGVRF
jgi:hypothetical protein